MTDRREFLLSSASFALACGGCSLPSVSPPCSREKIEAEIAELIKKRFFSCICIGNQYGQKWAVGNRRPESGAFVPVSSKSLFEVASVSKVMTASLASVLHCRGILDIDAPFTEYIPEHALAGKGTKISLRDLSVHSVGFSDGWFYHDWHRKGVYRAPEKFREGVLSQVPPPGIKRKYRYACHNMILLGYAVERAAGMDLDAAARKFIWGPLGMDSTIWHEIPGDGRTVQIYTKGVIPPGKKGDEKARVSGGPIGNAGVFTCLDDLMKYADDLVTRRTFPKKYYDLLFTPSFTSGRFRRSFGWNMSDGAAPPGWSDATISHAGYTGQYLAVDPVGSKFAVVLTNVSSSNNKFRAQAHRHRLRLAGMIS